MDWPELAERLLSQALNLERRLQIIKNYRTFTVLKLGNTLEQVERLIAAATNPRDALLVHIPSRTGIRVSELIGKGFKTWDFENRASSSR